MKQADLYEMLTIQTLAPPGEVGETITEINKVRDDLLAGKLWNDGDWLSAAIVKLAAYVEHLSGLVAQAEYEMNTAEAHYKLVRDRAILEERPGKLTVDAIKASANLETQVELKQWNDAIKSYKLLSLKRTDTNNLVDAARSRLSFMRAERERS